MIIEKNSILTTGERAKLSFSDKAGAEKLIRNKGYEPALYQGKRYAVKDGRAYPLDEKGISLGDIGDMAGGAVNLGIAVPAAAGGFFGGGIPGAVVGGAAGGAAGASAQRGIGQMLGVRESSLGQEALGVAGEAALGGITAGVIKGGAPIVKKAFQKTGSAISSKIATPTKKLLSNIGSKAKNLIAKESEKSFAQKANVQVPKWVNPSEVLDKKEATINFLKNKFGTNKSASEMIKRLSSEYKTLNGLKDVNSDVVILKGKDVLNLGQKMANDAVKKGYDITKGPGKKAFDYIGRRLNQAMTDNGEVSVKELTKMYHELGKKGFGGEASKDFLDLYKGSASIIREQLPTKIKDMLEYQAKIQNALGGLLKTASKDGKPLLSKVKTGIVGKTLGAKEMIDILTGK